MQIKIGKDSNNERTEKVRTLRQVSVNNKATMLYHTLATAALLNSRIWKLLILYRKRSEIGKK